MHIHIHIHIMIVLPGLPEGHPRPLPALPALRQGPGRTIIVYHIIICYIVLYCIIIYHIMICGIL